MIFSPSFHKQCFPAPWLCFLTHLCVCLSVRPFSLLVMKVDSLTSLGLRSLEDISKGSVYISNNTNLCYHHTMNWQRIFTGSNIKYRGTLNDIKFNKPKSQCGKMMMFWNALPSACAHFYRFTRCTQHNFLSLCMCAWVFIVAEGHMCDPLCSDSGCWGPGPEQCLSCRNHSRYDICVAQCNIFSGSVCVWLDWVYEWKHIYVVYNIIFVFSAFLYTKRLVYMCWQGAAGVHRSKQRVLCLSSWVSTTGGERDLQRRGMEEWGAFMFHMEADRIWDTPRI